MNPTDTLFIIKACEFLLEETNAQTTINQYAVLRKAHTNLMAYNFCVPRFKDMHSYTAGEMVLLINELANKFREVYQAGKESKEPVPVKHSDN